MTQSKISRQNKARDMKYLSGNRKFSNKRKKMHSQIKPSSKLIVYAILISLSIFELPFSITGISATNQVLLSPKVDDTPQMAEHKQEIEPIIGQIPSNHKMEIVEQKTSNENKQAKSRRQSRHYDSTISAASSSGGNYAAISGDGAAYVGQLSPTNYASSASNIAASNYQNDLTGSYNGANNYHDLLAMARGFTPSSSSSSSMMNHSPFNYYSGSASLPSTPPGYPSIPQPIFPTQATTPLSLPASFSSSMFPLLGKGFDVSEIICTAIAVAIGAVIVGAPFILIYLFIMNQVNGGNGPNGASISLTGPTSSTTVSGRKKRHTTLPEVLFKQLSPLVNNEQVAQTFKILMSSIAKYQH